METINNKPRGVIGESLIKGNLVTYGFNGKYYYYVGFGILETYAFGKMQLSFEQAKAAYEAIEFYSIDINRWDYVKAKAILKESQKNKLKGDKLMFYFGKAFKMF